MHTSQIKERFSGVARTIDNATLACQMSNEVPEELRDRVSELGKESDHTKQMLDKEDNVNSIIQCIDVLGKIGDRAMQSCNQGGKVDQNVQKAIREAHDAIAKLKHQLH